MDIVRPDCDPPHGWTPEHGLLVAILVQATHDLAMTGSTPSPFGKHGDLLAAEARQWFESREHGPFTFEDICDVLYLDPAAVREVIFRHVHCAQRFGRTSRFKNASALRHWVQQLAYVGRNLNDE